MVKNIKKCPFCGHDIEFFKGDGYILFMCNGLGCYTQMKTFTDNLEIAVEKWNRRIER